jgi:hypothetical protein
MLKPSEMLEYLMLRNMTSDPDRYWAASEKDLLQARLANLEVRYWSALWEWNRTRAKISSLPTAGPSTTSDLSN